LRPRLSFPVGGGALCSPAAAGWQSWQGVVPRELVVVGEGRAPEILPLVVVVADETFHVVVVVMVMIYILKMCWMTLDPGRLLKAMSNRECNLLLSRLLLPY